ncbi:MAG: hypothetical protein HPY85_04755 [Anaerolineae bacterium]|nr:hypothetical protein [Anaerolineae bacterium]
MKRIQPLNNKPGNSHQTLQKEQQTTPVNHLPEIVFRQDMSPLESSLPLQQTKKTRPGSFPAPIASFRQRQQLMGRASNTSVMDGVIRLVHQDNSRESSL